MLNLLRNSACVLAVLLATSCGEKPDAATMAAEAEAKETAPAINTEQTAALKAIIAKSGGQCADVVSMQGEDLSNKVKVTCSGQAARAGTISYTVDLETEQVQDDG